MVTNAETHIGPSMAKDWYRRNSKQFDGLVHSILELGWNYGGIAKNAFFDTKDALIGRLSKLYNECWDILWRSDADIHDMACQLEWQFWCRVTLNNSRRCGTAFEVDMRSMSQCCKVGLGVYGTTTIPPRRFSNSGESFFENPWWNDLLESILTVRILAPFEMSAARNAITKSHVTRSASSGACKAIRNWNPMLSSSIPISLR